MPVEIQYLADHQDAVPFLARSHFAEWGDLLPWWTCADAVDELRTHTGRRAIPTTLVAVDDARVIGSVSLLEDDLPGWGHLTPWLASLFVVADERKRGIGARLVDACVREAAALGAPLLYLFTAGQEEYYRSKGWELIEHIVLSGKDATILSRATGA